MNDKYIIEFYPDQMSLEDLERVRDNLKYMLDSVNIRIRNKLLTKALEDPTRQIFYVDM